MNSRYHVLEILTSHNSRLLCTKDEYLAAMLQYLPLAQLGEELPKPKTYAEAVKEELVALSAKSNVEITSDYSSTGTNPGTIAYHRIKGLILADYYWWGFSTKQFERDLLAADSNPNLYCHFVHITSGGGEAWYLDRLSETMRALAKPVYVLIEKTCCSAGYYIGCHGAKTMALTQNDLVGCIGTMVSFWDMEGYLKTLGFNKIEEYATKSDLKNKKYNDLRNGKPDQFIHEELDPLQVQFEVEVRNSRKALKKLEENHPVVRGETYDAIHAQAVGLIDGIITLPEALDEAYQMGLAWQKKQQLRTRAASFI